MLTPVLVVAGFLGSGKTTLLNHLLSNDAGMRIGVIVNDFGAVNVDAMLVAGQADATMTLTNGCICCAVGSEDFDELLRTLASRDDIDLIVIEASGIAEPASMVSLLLSSALTEIRYGGLIYVLDAAHLSETIADHPQVGWHAGLADLIVLNKVDAFDDPEQVEDLKAIARSFNDSAPIIATTKSRVALELLTDVDVRARLPEAEKTQLTFDDVDHSSCSADADCDHGCAGHGAVEHLHDKFSSVVFTSDTPMHPRRLGEFLERLPVGAYRLKGVARFAEYDHLHAFEIQSVAGIVQAKIDTTRDTRETSIVVIGVDLDGDAILADLASCVRCASDGPDEQAILSVLRFCADRDSYSDF